MRLLNQRVHSSALARRGRAEDVPRAVEHEVLPRAVPHPARRERRERRRRAHDGAGGQRVAEARRVRQEEEDARQRKGIGKAIEKLSYFAPAVTRQN